MYLFDVILDNLAIELVDRISSDTHNPEDVGDYIIREVHGPLHVPIGAATCSNS